MRTIRYTEEEQTKKERLEARISPRAKKLIEEAAMLEGRTVSDFVVQHAQEAARSVIEKYNFIALSARDSKSFVEALLNPPAPNERLKRAAARHKKLISEK